MNLLTPIPQIQFPNHKPPIVTPILENMSCLNDYFHCDSKYNHWVENNEIPLKGSSPYIMARDSIVAMLFKAQAFLPEGYTFCIFDAYRPIAVQQSLWDYFRQQKRRENPDKTEEEIDKITAFCVSFPSYNILIPSLHNTGGAVDLNILDSDGNELDMGCDFDDFTERAWTNYYEIHPVSEKEITIRDNRRMLYNAMIGAGFTNLPSEWWHFDYGDDKWAAINNTYPIYTGILDANVKDTVPYNNMNEIREIDLKQQSFVESLVIARKNCAYLGGQLINSVKTNT